MIPETAEVILDELGMRTYQTGRLLGRGANNAVHCLLDEQGEETGLVLRRPLRKADTKARKIALLEAEASIRASKAGDGVKVLAAWFVPRSEDTYRRGLYTVLARLSGSLHHKLKVVQGEDEAARCAKELALRIKGLSAQGIFCVDIKPDNVGFVWESDRLFCIDFGGEWTMLSGEGSELQRHLDSISTRSEVQASLLEMGMRLLMQLHLVNEQKYARRQGPHRVMSHMNREWKNDAASPQDFYRFMRHKMIKEQIKHYFEPGRTEELLRRCGADPLLKPQKPQSESKCWAFNPSILFFGRKESCEP